MNTFKKYHIGIFVAAFLLLIMVSAMFVFGTRSASAASVNPIFSESGRGSRGSRGGHSGSSATSTLSNFEWHHSTVGHATFLTNIIAYVHSHGATRPHVHPRVTDSAGVPHRIFGRSRTSTSTPSISTSTPPVASSTPH